MEEAIFEMVAYCDGESLVATRKLLLSLFADKVASAAERPTPSELNKVLRALTSRGRIYMRKDHGTYWTTTTAVTPKRPSAERDVSGEEAATLSEKKRGTFAKLPLGVSRVTEQLYIGSARDANDAATLRSLGVTALVSLVPVWRLDHDSMRHLVVPVQDEEWVDLMAHVQRVTEFVNVNPGQTTLIHCHCGKSRSVAMCLAVLCESGMPLADSWALVKEARSIAAPNSGFVRQLLARYPGASWDHFVERDQTVTLKQWLECHGKTKGGKMPTTHLYWTPNNRRKRMYHVAVTKQPEFESRYAQAVLSASETPRLVECITSDTFRLYLDVDVKTLEEEPRVGRLVDAVMPLLAGNGRAAVSGASSAFKLGLHVVFPDLIVDKNAARQFISKLRSTVKLPEWISACNRVEDVFDMSPIEGANMRMLYSAKSIPCKICKKKKQKKQKRNMPQGCPACNGTQLEPERIYSFLGLFGDDATLLDMYPGDSLADIRKRVELCSIRAK